MKSVGPTPSGAPVPAARLPAVANAPACGGLRRDLLQRWQQGFPIDHSPFQAVARHAGGTLREVLGHCQALVDAGALDVIRVRWSPRLARLRWRCCAEPPAAELPALEATLRTMPGVTRMTLVDPLPSSGKAVPALWFDLVAHDLQAAAAQRRHFEARHGSLQVIELAGGGPGDGRNCDGGPCCQPELARRCEAGLPLVAHPFELLACEQQASEREVLGILRRWQRCGALQSLALAPPQAVHESHGAVAWIAAADDAALQSLALQLRSASGVDAVEPLPAADAWPWRLMAAAHGSPQQACRLLERELAAAGAAATRHAVVPVRRVVWRSEPLLFAGMAS